MNKERSISAVLLRNGSYCESKKSFQVLRQSQSPSNKLTDLRAHERHLPEFIHEESDSFNQHPDFDEENNSDPIQIKLLEQEQKKPIQGSNGVFQNFSKRIQPAIYPVKNNLNNDQNTFVTQGVSSHKKLLTYLTKEQRQFLYNKNQKIQSKIRNSRRGGKSGLITQKMVFILKEKEFIDDLNFKTFLSPRQLDTLNTVIQKEQDPQESQKDWLDVQFQHPIQEEQEKLKEDQTRRSPIFKTAPSSAIGFMNKNPTTTETQINRIKKKSELIKHNSQKSFKSYTKNSRNSRSPETASKTTQKVIQPLFGDPKKTKIDVKPFWKQEIPNGKLLPYSPPIKTMGAKHDPVHSKIQFKISGSTSVKNIEKNKMLKQETPIKKWKNSFCPNQLTEPQSWSEFALVSSKKKSPQNIKIYSEKKTNPFSIDLSLKLKPQIENYQTDKKSKLSSKQLSPQFFYPKENQRYGKKSKKIQNLKIAIFDDECDSIINSPNFNYARDISVDYQGRVDEEEIEETHPDDEDQKRVQTSDSADIAMTLQSQNRKPSLKGLMYVKHIENSETNLLTCQQNYQKETPRVAKKKNMAQIIEDCSTIKGISDQNKLIEESQKQPYPATSTTLQDLSIMIISPRNNEEEVSGRASRNQH